MPMVSTQRVKPVPEPNYLYTLNLLRLDSADRQQTEEFYSQRSTLK
jgi:hypothetical protein